MTKSLKPVLPVLIAACLLLMLSFGYRAGFGLFMQPMTEARGWGRDVLSMALAIQNLCWGLFAVIAGGLADRYGNIRVLLTAVALYAAGMWTMAFSVNEWQIMSSTGILVGAGIAGTSFGIVLPALARAVPQERRSWALGLGTAAGSLGQFLVVPFMQELIQAFGWLQTLQILSISSLLMALLAMPLAPFSEASETASSTSGNVVPMWQILQRALRVRSFQLLSLGFFVCGFHVAFITVHMPGYVVDLGFDARIGAWSISLIGLFNIIGAYYSGVLSGRRPMHKLLAFIYLGRVVAISLFLLIPISLTSILIFSGAMGLLWLATVPPTSALVAVFFGTRYMTLLYGFVFFSHQMGSFSGIWLGGWLYEHFASYDGIWIAGIILGAVAAGLHWPIQETDHTQHLQLN